MNLRWVQGAIRVSAGLLFAAAIVFSLQSEWSTACPFWIAAWAVSGFGFLFSEGQRTFAFTSFVLASVAASLGYPAWFGSWFGLDLKTLIVPLIQVIMFGMGTTLCLADFARVLKMPRPVLIGVSLQYLIMPLSGFLLASVLQVDAEIAAGVILIGSCPGGVASNLMCFIAKADVALSVTMTSISTLLSPLMTPLMMTLLASQYVEIDFVGMMLGICNMIIVPIAAGLIANRLLDPTIERWNRPVPLSNGLLISLVGATVAGWLGEARLGPLQSGLLVGFAMIAMVVFTKLLVNVIFDGPTNWMDRVLPIVSMAGICYIIAIITARSSEDLLQVGWLLVLVAVAQNSLGYSLGYGGALVLGLDRRSCRTVALEVGMQNGGMASGLAINSLGSAKAAIAPAIFGPLMNITGSLLASCWARGAESPDSDSTPRVKSLAHRHIL